jgi:UDP-N-acetylglucosamine acyltransferase
METRVGNNSLFMLGVHIAHDCVVGNNLVFGNNATLAGHVTVGDNAIIGGLAAIHQNVRIGRNAIIGGLSPVSRDVPPFSMVSCDHAKIDGANITGLKRSNVDHDEIRVLSNLFGEIFNDSATMRDNLDRIQTQWGEYPSVRHVLDFMMEDSVRSYSLLRDRRGAGI